jgi:hypothetical protein
VQDGDVGRLEVAEVGVEVLVHVLEDRAVLERHVTQSLDVLRVPFLEDLVGNAQRFQ